MADVCIRASPPVLDILMLHVVVSPQEVHLMKPEATHHIRSFLHFMTKNVWQPSKEVSEEAAIVRKKPPNISYLSQYVRQRRRHTQEMQLSTMDRTSLWLMRGE